MTDASAWPPTRLSGTSTAPPQVVYDLISDLGTHMSWGGTDSAKIHLTSVEAPEGPATTGTEFTSTGVDFSGNTFKDRSVVTEANAPSVFAFRTDARMDYKKGNKEPWLITLEHRYEISPEGTGSRINYIARTTEANYLAWYLTTPGVRSLTAVMVNSMMGKGFKNMLKISEERASTA